MDQQQPSNKGHKSHGQAKVPSITPAAGGESMPSPSPPKEMKQTGFPLAIATLANQTLTLITKKAQFRKYLQKSGFKYAIIRALVALYEDPVKPDDPLSWIFEFVGQGIPSQATLDLFRTDIQALRTKIETLQQENAELKKKVEEKEEASKPDPMAEWNWDQFVSDPVPDHFVDPVVIPQT